MYCSHRFVFLLAVLGCAAFFLVTAEAKKTRVTKDRVLAWLHENARSSVVTNNLGDGSSAIRSLAILSAAMFDAVNAVEQKYEPYLVQFSEIPSTINLRNANPVAALNEAARGVLRFVYPSTIGSQGLEYFYSDLASILTKTIEDQEDNVAHGIALGRYVASRIIENRANDGHPPPRVPVVNGTQPGKYSYGWYPQSAFPFSSGYYLVKPFGVSSYEEYNQTVFYVPPPPTLNDPAHLIEWQELYGFGTSRQNESTRTDATDQAALFFDGYFGSSTGFACDVLAQSEIYVDGVDLLRILTIAAMSSHDAHGFHWKWKYHYLRWRPFQAYRYAGTGIAALDQYRDPNWVGVLQLGPLPGYNNPEYPSGHSSRTAAFVDVFKLAFGNRLQYTTMSFSVPGTTRSYNSFDEFAYDVDESRIKGGVHWRSAVVQGHAYGSRVAAHYWHTLLRPL